MAELELITGRDKTLKALQEIELEGLKELDRLCRKHNIKYSLGGGTCLGQLRHGGFIPWDDDIDIDMTTENYEKFIQVALKELDTNRFFLRCRYTDKNWKRSFSRIEMKYTRIGPKSWDKIPLKSGIFIDLFEWNYLPNSKFKRKIYTNILFFIRWMEMYKTINNYNLNPKYKTLMMVLRKIIPTSLLFKVEDYLKRKYKNTDWIIDNAVINGNHGGYLSAGIDEYKDVPFENITVMNKKNAHNFMRTIYGDHYMEWLPPSARISHHRWNYFNFGVYAPKFDLPIDYQKYLTINFIPEKLQRMKEVSLEMLDDINKVCVKNKLTYFVSGKDAYIKLNNVDEFGTYFREPLKIAMPRKDYEKFSKIASEELGNKYFYQDMDTDPKYKYSYARVRLNYTYIRDNNVPKFIEEQYNNGFYIKVIPLDNTSNNIKERERHARKIRYLNHFISLKWKRYNIRYFIKKNIKFKIKMIILLPFSLNYLIKKLNKETNKYNNTDTNYYIDSTGYQLDYKVIKKSVLKKGKMLEYFGHTLMFPSSLEEYQKYLKPTVNYQKINDLKYIKENFNDSYLELATEITKKQINKIQKKYAACFLTYYDIPDYQLSVLRYDEKNKKYLSNEEILNYNKEEV